MAVATMLPFHATSAQAASFVFQFDNTSDGSVTPPIVGTGTFSFDGPPVAGTFPLSSLPNYKFSFHFGDFDFAFDIATPSENILVSINSFDSDFSVNFGGSAGGPYGGSIDFIDSSYKIFDLILFFEPDFGSRYVLGVSTPQSVYFGTYQAVAAAPGPLPLLGAGVALGWSSKLRKRVKSSQPEVIPTTLF